MKKFCLLMAVSFLMVKAGAQWTKIPSGTSRSLNDLHFVHAHTGYCVGDSGTVLKTTDGGNSWTVLAPFTGDDIVEVYFKNEDTGWVNAYAGGIFQTDDGGSSFYSLTPVFDNPDPSQVLNRSYMSFNGNTGIIRGYFAGQPQTAPPEIFSYKTTDGGKTWKSFEFPGEVVQILNEDTLFSADHYLYQSHDGGLHWDTLTNILLAFPPLGNKCFKIFDGNGNGIASLHYHFNLMNLSFSGNQLSAANHPVLKNIISMSFPSGKTGYALQSAEFWPSQSPTPWPPLYKTTDGGINFQKLQADSFYVNNLFFVTENLGFACGKNGGIYKTANGGATGVPRANKEGLKLFPNPASKTIFLDYEGSQPEKIVLFNMAGKLLKEYPPLSRQLDISDFPAGFYTLKISEKKENRVFKIAVVK